MNKHLSLFCLLLTTGMLCAQVPAPTLVGYWHNWNDWNAPYIDLDEVDGRYNLVSVAFALPAPGTDYHMTFSPDQVSQAVFIDQMQTLQSQGRKVLLSIGGATAHISLDTEAERDTFVSTINQIIQTYGFDGMDIDLEGASVTVTGGTIENPVDAKIIHLIEATQQIMADYQAQNNKKFLLTMAPETAFVQGGMSGYGSIWGAYLPIIHALRDSIDLLHVQLYNSGTMYGIDGNIYSQGTADFIVAMTEAVIQGFHTAGGFFAGLPAAKVAVGLPACPSAAGGGYVSPAVVQSAVEYLLGTGSQPGAYVLVQSGGYPDLGGMMTWSVNWDAVSTCGALYEYAENFELIFGTFLPVELLRFQARPLAALHTQLVWETASETNFRGFEVQRSSDGRNFQTLGYLSAGAADGEGTNYTFQDKEISTPGTYYYRLRLLDENLSHTYSQVEVVIFRTSEERIAIVPNPASGRSCLQFVQALNGAVRVQVFDAMGRLVLTQKDMLWQGDQELCIELGAVEAGVYLVSLDMPSGPSFVGRLAVLR